MVGALIFAPLSRTRLALRVDMICIPLNNTVTPVLARKASFFNDPIRLKGIVRHQKYPHILVGGHDIIGKQDSNDDQCMACKRIPALCLE